MSKKFSEKVVVKEVIRRIIDALDLSGEIVSKWCVFDVV